MTWERRETHHVAAYTFHWFARDDGSWLIAIWGQDSGPVQPTEQDLADALTVHHVPARDNPTGRLKPLRDFCERFVSDIPFRVQAIRMKSPTVRRLVEQGALATQRDGPA